MKDRKYDKRHVWSKNHSGCLETLCHVRGPLRNKMATLGVSSDIDPRGGCRILSRGGVTPESLMKGKGRARSARKFLWCAF